MTTRFGWLGLSSAVLLAMCVPALGDDIILEWNAIALQVDVIDHNGLDTPGDQLSDTQGPPAGVRVLALVHAAMFEAYNAVDPKYTSYLGQPIPSPPGASIDAAVAQAAHDVIVGLFPGNQAPRPEIREFVGDALAATLAGVPKKSSRNKGRTVGKVVAKKLLKQRRGDDDFLGGTYTPMETVGDHNVDPKNPQQSFISPDIGWLPPFGVADILAFTPGDPPSPDAPAGTEEGDLYRDAYNQVKEKGVFRGGVAGEPFDLSDETYIIANYWSYNGSPGTGVPPRLYNQIARAVAIRAGNSECENARLFALLNIAMGDAGISAWNTKYLYRYWRPILGIRQVDFDGNDLEDGNTDTVACPTWCPLGGSRSNPIDRSEIDGVIEKNFSPPFPAYTSGHATFGAAAFKVLANFYQSDTIPADVNAPGAPFIFISDEWNGTTRDQFNRVRPLVPLTYTSFNCMAAENAASRVFNGVHWSYDGVAGVWAGYGIADEIFDNLLRPLGGGGDTSIPDEDFETKISDIIEDTPTGPPPS